VGEAEQVGGGADFAEGLEAELEGGEVEWAVVLVDLDGVAAAEGDVGAGLAGEMAEDAATADLTARVGRGGGDRGVFACPEVVGAKGAEHEVGPAGEELEGLCGLQAGGEVDGCGEDAGGVAGFDVA